MHMSTPVQTRYPAFGPFTGEALQLFLRQGRDLTLHEISVALEGEVVLKGAVPYRDPQTQPFIHLQCVEGIIVSFCVDSAHGRRLITGYSYHAAVPLGDALLVGLGFSFDFCEKTVIVTLQRLMGARRAHRIKHKLYCAEQRRCSPSDGLGEPDPGENSAHGRRTGQNDEEVDPSGLPLELEPARGVIQRVAQDIEADVLDCLLHDYFSFCGRGGVGRGIGCRGPMLPCPFPGAPDGCRGPRLLFIFSYSPLITALHDSESVIGAEGCPNTPSAPQLNLPHRKASSTLDRKRYKNYPGFYSDRLYGKPSAATASSDFFFPINISYELPAPDMANLGLLTGRRLKFRLSTEGAM